MDKDEIIFSFSVIKVIDRCCQVASCFIVGFMFLLLILSKTPAASVLPECLAAGAVFRKYVIPVLSSAAIGYLTNAIAIWMLFKPYEKHWFWPQGVIPGRKKSFGRELGKLIPQYLLQPEKISAQIGKVVLQYLKDPLFIQKIRDYVTSFLEKQSMNISGVVVPYVQNFAFQTVQDMMTYDNARHLSQIITQKYLLNSDTRKKTVQTVIHLIKELIPQVSQDFQQAVAEKVAKSFRKEHPILSWWKENLGGESIEDEVRKFWVKGEDELLANLGRESTQEKLSEYLAKLLLMGKDYMEKSENMDQIEKFILQKRDAVEKMAGEYLSKKIPAMADDLLSSDPFWIMLEEKALPAMQLYVVKQLRRNGGELLQKFDLPGKIENAIDKMNTKDLHHFVVQASNDNLTTLQVFGFFLGGIAGVIMAFVI